MTKEPASFYKKRAMKAAKDLRYPPSVIDLLKSAKTEQEIQRIMITARHNKFDKKE